MDRFFWVKLTLVWLMFLPIQLNAQERVYARNTVYEIIEGDIFRVEGDGRRFVEELYDPSHLVRSYLIADNAIHRIIPQTGTSVPTKQALSEDFEDVADIVEAIGPDQNWTALTLRSPFAPDVPTYVSLWQDIANGLDSCHDNCVQVLMEGGNTVMQAQAVAPNRQTGVSKASLDTGLLHLTDGDSFRFSADFLIVEGQPISLFDIESSYMREGPGLRLMLNDEGVPWVELKWADKPRWLPLSNITVPEATWFNITLEIHVSRDNGRVMLWLDDQPLIDGTGQTLHLATAVLDRMELGITAADTGPTTVQVDNVEFYEWRAAQ